MAVRYDVDDSVRRARNVAPPLLLNDFFLLPKTFFLLAHR